MALIADSGALYALYDKRDSFHESVKAAVSAEPGPIVVPVAILAEVSYLLLRLGVRAEQIFLDNILSGAFTLCPFDLDDAAMCKDLLLRYHDLNLGLADASVIVAAEKLGVSRILTVDARDFRVVLSGRGKPFELIPADVRRPKKR